MGMYKAFHCNIVCAWKGPECLPVERGNWTLLVCPLEYTGMYVAIKKKKKTINSMLSMEQFQDMLLSHKTWVQISVQKKREKI